MDDITIKQFEKLTQFLNSEISPAQLASMLDDAYYIITMQMAENDGQVPMGANHPGEVIFNLYRLRNILNECA